MASGAAAIGQSGFAAFGGIALQKAMLAFAPDFRRLVLTFHFIISVKIDIATFPGSNPPAAANPRSRVGEDSG
jgi:hypothetical protein